MVPPCASIEDRVAHLELAAVGGGPQLEDPARQRRVAEHDQADEVVLVGEVDHVERAALGDLEAARVARHHRHRDVEHDHHRDLRQRHVGADVGRDRQHRVERRAVPAAEPVGLGPAGHQQAAALVHVAGQQLELAAGEGVDGAPHTTAP
jgi:hypothetical protein